MGTKIRNPDQFCKRSGEQNRTFAFAGVFTNKTGTALVRLLIKRPINGGNIGRPNKAKFQDLCKWKSYLS